MSRYLLALGLVFCSHAAGACGLDDNKYCGREQSGAEYTVDVPLEKFTTDCDAGVDCHHMQSGQHYSVQSPLKNES
jgi:hypothetical protein